MYDAARPTAVRCALCGHKLGRVFHIDTEAISGVGDGGRTILQENSVLVNLNPGFKVFDFGCRKKGIGFPFNNRRSVLVAQLCWYMNMAFRITVYIPGTF